MLQSLPTITVQALHNPRASAGLSYGEERRKILGPEAFFQARNEISSWPGYEPTPLLARPGLAAAAGVGRVFYKDESQRFGLGSFKALGGAYAVNRLLIRELQRRTHAESVTTADLIGGKYRDLTQNIIVTCATDGNHGRSVAWGARLFGCRCIVYLHATVSQGREQAIAHYGAEVVRASGNYDDAVRQAALDADRYGRFVVSDTSYEGYTDVPRDVMQGYTLMVDEAMQQLDGRLPSHIFIQGGVGGLAAAVCGHYWQRHGARRPRVSVVEPDRADCIFQSVKAGRPIAVTGDLDTIMAGLSCGEVSLLAWEILKEGADDVIVIDDQAAIDCMRLLASDFAGDTSVVAGESAVAGVAGFIGVAGDPALRERFGIADDSCILLFGSEGATDPALYREIVGGSTERVR